MRNFIRSERFELRISTVCDQACVFCCEWENMENSSRKFMPFAQVVRILLSKRKSGSSHVTFIGGEPTLHPDFEKIISLAWRMGYRTQLSTNGLRFASEKFSRNVLPHLTEICFAVHGINEPDVRTAMGKSGNFKLLCSALDNISRYGSGTILMCDTVVYSRNKNRLGDIFSFLLRRTPIKLYMISNIVPAGAALENYAKLAVTLEDITKLVPGLVSISRRSGVDLRFFGVPACILGPHWQYSNDFHWSPRSMVESRGKRNCERLNLKPSLDRIKTTKCRSCRFKSWCGGVFSVYKRKFGLQELSPVS